MLGDWFGRWWEGDQHKENSSKVFLAGSLAVSWDEGSDSLMFSGWCRNAKQLGKICRNRGLSLDQRWHPGGTSHFRVVQLGAPGPVGSHAMLTTLLGSEASYWFACLWLNLVCRFSPLTSSTPLLSVAVNVISPTKHPQRAPGTKPSMLG